MLSTQPSYEAPGVPGGPPPDLAPEPAETPAGPEVTPPVTPEVTPTPDVPATPEPVVQPDLRQQQELEWYRRAQKESQDQIANLRTQMTEYETANLTEEERARYDLTQQQEAVEGQQREVAEALYASDLYRYYSQFVPAAVIQGNNPSEWQDAVMKYQVGLITDLQEQVKTLQGAAQPGQGAPQVAGAPPAGAPTTKTVWQMTKEERDAKMDESLSGLTGPTDYLPAE